MPAVKTSVKSSTTKPKSSKKTTKSTKSQKPVEEPPAPTPAAAPVEETNSEHVTVTEPDQVTIETSMTETLQSFSDSIQSLTAAITKLKADYKTLEKQVLKEARVMDKAIAKRNKSKGTRAPSGFVKPTAISKELASFLSVSADTTLARTQVTKMITAYVKENKLQAPDNGRKILPDKKLMDLLKCKSDEEVTYFNLQKFMKPHFVKA
uniref:Swib-Domain Containing Protein n=1 Tax=Florenciella sp. virus SA2 TaxID=3240092 RepID=A0AB39J6Q2_9VIRU